MRWILLSLALPLAACTAQPAPIGDARTNTLAGRVAGPAQSCVPTQPTRNLQIVDESTLVYGSGGTVYLNHLRAACPGLNPTTTLIFDLHASQYCSGDHFRTIETGSSVPGPVCLLGDWVPYRTP
jgi:hypothetical protein